MDTRDPYLPSHHRVHHFKGEENNEERDSGCGICMFIRDCGGAVKWSQRSNFKHWVIARGNDQQQSGRQSSREQSSNQHTSGERQPSDQPARCRDRASVRETDAQTYDAGVEHSVGIRGDRDAQVEWKDESGCGRCKWRRPSRCYSSPHQQQRTEREQRQYDRAGDRIRTRHRAGQQGRGDFGQAENGSG